MGELKKMEESKTKKEREDGLGSRQQANWYRGEPGRMAVVLVSTAQFRLHEAKRGCCLGEKRGRMNLRGTAKKKGQETGGTFCNRKKQGPYKLLEALDKQEGVYKGKREPKV